MKIMEQIKKVSVKHWAVCLAAVVLLIVLLIVLLMLPRQVADAANLGPLSRKPRYGVQEPRAWGQGQISLADAPIAMDGYQIYRYKLDEKLLEQYIAMLQKNGFTLVGEHHQSSLLGSYQSYGLVCDAATEVPTKKMMYTDTQCHVCIWKENSKWRIEVVDDITLWDMGARCDGTQGDILPAGTSLGESLKWGMGQYQTGTPCIKLPINCTHISFIIYNKCCSRVSYP